MYILLIFSTLAASTYLNYRPIVVVPLAYDTCDPGRQCTYWALFARGYRLDAGGPQMYIFADFHHYGGL